MSKKAKIESPVERSLEEDERLLDELFQEQILKTTTSTTTSSDAIQEETNIVYAAPAKPTPSGNPTQSSSSAALQREQQREQQQLKKETEKIAFLAELRKEEEEKKEEEDLNARLQRLKDMRKTLSSSKQTGKRANETTQKSKSNAIILTPGVKRKAKPGTSVKRGFLDEDTIE